MSIVRDNYHRDTSNLSSIFEHFLYQARNGPANHKLYSKSNPQMAQQYFWNVQFKKKMQLTLKSRR